MTHIDVEVEQTSRDIPVRNLGMGECGILSKGWHVHQGSIVQMTSFGLTVFKDSTSPGCNGDGWSMQTLNNANYDDHYVTPIKSIKMVVRT